MSFAKMIEYSLRKLLFIANQDYVTLSNIKMKELVMKNELKLYR